MRGILRNMKKSTIVISSIMFVMVCWFSILLVACKKEGIIATPGDAHPVEKTMQPVAFDDSALQKEIADLKAQIGAIHGENEQLKVQRAKLAEENSRLKYAQKDVDAQKARLADENKALLDQNEYLKKQNATLQYENTQLKQSLAESESAKQGLEKQLANASSEPEKTQKVQQAEETRPVQAVVLADNDSSDSKKDVAAPATSQATAVKSSSQVRNVLGFKIGPDLLDIEATLAIMPHWFLIVNAGMVETPVDFVEDKFPGHKSNRNIFSGKYNFLYDVMGGMGLNWQFNSLPAQPNLYLSTMLGPAWFMYKEDGDLTSKMYLLWRTSVGFDLTIYKDLLFTTDIGFDWMEDYDFTPRLAVGFLWRYSQDWSLFGRKK